MRARTDLVGLAAAVLLVSALAGCDGGTDAVPDAIASTAAVASPTSQPGTVTAGEGTPTATADPEAAPEAAPEAEPTPGQPCEPGSHPDCSDATGTEGEPYRIIAGYAYCLALHGPDEVYGLCTDLDGDFQAGYADAG